MKLFVVIVGDPFDGGMELYGPFTLEEAQLFHEEVGIADGIVEFAFDDIVRLKSPDEWKSPHEW